MRGERTPPPEAVPEPQLPGDVIAAYRSHRDRFRDALRRRDDAAAEQALSAFATAAIRAGFTKRTARAAVQVVGEEVARLASPYRRDRRPVLALWTRRYDDVYDELLAAGDVTA
jgi:hypothetical protein